MKIVQDVSFDFGFLKRKPDEFVMGADIDYYRLFVAIKQQHSSCYLFESLNLARYQDRYFTIGFDPILQFIAKGDQLTIKGSTEIMKRVTGMSDPQLTLTDVNPYAVLKQIQMDHVSKTHQGGLIGYFSYESANYFEPAIQLEEHPDFAPFHMGLYSDGLIYDKETGLLTYYTFDEDRSTYVRELIHGLDKVVIPNRLESVTVRGRSETPEEYGRAVANTLAEVHAGNTFQCEVGFKTFYELQGDKIAVYDELRRINPTPYMYYVQFDEVELCGASPELLIANTQDQVLTTPLAGTIRRGADKQEDKRLARELLTDPKEIAEHNMLVDLHRNDLARVCDVGSVRVIRLMDLMRFSHVQHIVSEVVGRLSKTNTAYDLLAAILPGGVVSGAPKIETMKIIDQNESLPRGPYGGAVGRFSFNGDSAFCLPIRSLFCHGDQCFTQTSSGVVMDSDVDKEYAEVRAKLAQMEQTIQRLQSGGVDHG